MYRYYIAEHFKKQLKPHLKKHRSLVSDVIRVLREFDPRREVALGEGTYKLRLSAKDLGKGKSKSYRLIVLLIEIDKLLVPVCIYFKGDKDNISKKEIRYHLGVIKEEIEGL